MEEALIARYHIFNERLQQLKHLSGKTAELAVQNHDPAQDHSDVTTKVEQFVREAREAAEQARECLRAIESEDHAYAADPAANQEEVALRKSLYKTHTRSLLHDMAVLERGNTDDGEEEELYPSDVDSRLEPDMLGSPRLSSTADESIDLSSVASSAMTSVASTPRSTLNVHDINPYRAASPSPSIAPSEASSLESKRTVYVFKTPSSQSVSSSFKFDPIKDHEDDWMRGGNAPIKKSIKQTTVQQDAGVLFSIFQELQLMVDPAVPPTATNTTKATTAPSGTADAVKAKGQGKKGALKSSNKHCRVM